jgi:hypothetical protein
MQVLNNLAAVNWMRWSFLTIFQDFMFAFMAISICDSPQPFGGKVQTHIKLQQRKVAFGEIFETNPLITY